MNNINPYLTDQNGNYYQIATAAKPQTTIAATPNSALHNYLMGMLLAPKTPKTPTANQVAALNSGAGPVNAKTADAMASQPNGVQDWMSSQTQPLGGGNSISNFAAQGLNPPSMAVTSANKSSY